jgi:hypothetical protein
VWCQGTIFLGLLIPSQRSELHDSLHTDVQGPSLFSDVGFRHAFTKVLQQQVHASILRE